MKAEPSDPAGDFLGHVSGGGDLYILRRECRGFGYPEQQIGG
jgi:hypothetical protein